MSILNQKSKKMLVESMRSCVKEILTESTHLTAKQATKKSKFISENATYEQLLNITLNPNRDSNYLPSYVLEGAVAILHRACLTGRQRIGVNAITEGALKLHNETGAVITESMLDAALNSVNEGMGLKVVGKILKEGSLEGFFGQKISSYVKGEVSQDPSIRALKNAIATSTDKVAAGQAYTAAFNNAVKQRTAQYYNAALSNPSALPTQLVKQLGGIEKVMAMKDGGKEAISALMNGKTNNIKQEISRLQSRLSRLPENARNPQEVQRLKSLTRKFNQLTGRSVSTSSNVTNNAILNQVNKASKKGMNPWLAAGIGGLALAGGMYGYNKLKNRNAGQE